MAEASRVPRSAVALTTSTGRPSSASSSLAKSRKRSAYSAVGVGRANSATKSRSLRAGSKLPVAADPNRSRRTTPWRRQTSASAEEWLAIKGIMARLALRWRLEEGKRSGVVIRCDRGAGGTDWPVRSSAKRGRGRVASAGRGERRRVRSRQLSPSRRRWPPARSGGAAGAAARRRAFRQAQGPERSRGTTVLQFSRWAQKSGARIARAARKIVGSRCALSLRRRWRSRRARTSSSRARGDTRDSGAR